MSGTEILTTEAIAAVRDGDEDRLRATLAGMTRDELYALSELAKKLDDRAFRAWSQRAPVAWGS